jgi:hypothetical protein
MADRTADNVQYWYSESTTLQNAVTEWGSTFQERGLEINIAKSKIMKIRKV